MAGVTRPPLYQWPLRILHTVILMGARQSTLSHADVDMLTAATHFTGDELNRLYERFMALDRDRSGTLSAEELLALPEFSMNPLSPCLLSMLLCDGERELNFVDFVKFLSVFHERAGVEEKAELVGRLLRRGGDGERGLRPVLQAMVGKHLSDNDIDGIVKRTMAAVDADGDGKIGAADLLATIPHQNIATMMTIKSAVPPQQPRPL